MKSVFAAILPLALTLLPSGASATEGISLDWSADGSFDTALTIPAGKFVEACGKLPAKTKVSWRFEAGGPVDFNIHFHAGKQVIFPAQENQVARAGGTLDADSEQDYCWMWTNKGKADTPLQLSLMRR